MRRPRVLLCTAEPDAARWQEELARALPGADVSCWPEGCRAPDYAVVSRPPDALFTHIAPPRAIFNLGAGVDALLRLDSLPPRVPVIRLEDAGMAAQMAEYVTLAVLAAHRDAQGYCRRQAAGTWEIAKPRPAGNFGVGLLGLGVLGRSCAAALAPFGFPLSGWGRERRCVPGVETHAGRDGLDRVLAGAHVLVCLLPSTPDTRNLLDRVHLSRLPRGAHVVNVARGDLLVDDDLLALLETGHLGGRGPRRLPGGAAARGTSFLASSTDHRDAARGGAHVAGGIGRAGRRQDPPPRARRGDHRHRRSRARVLNGTMNRGQASSAGRGG